MQSRAHRGCCKAPAWHHPSTSPATAAATPALDPPAAGPACRSPERARCDARATQARGSQDPAASAPTADPPAAHRSPPPLNPAGERHPRCVGAALPDRRHRAAADQDLPRLSQGWPPNGTESVSHCATPARQQPVHPAGPAVRHRPPPPHCPGGIGVDRSTPAGQPLRPHRARGRGSAAPRQNGSNHHFFPPARPPDRWC